MAFASEQNIDSRKNSWLQQLITGDRYYVSVCRPGVSLAIEALNGLVQCAPLTSSMTSLVSHSHSSTHDIPKQLNPSVAAQWLAFLFHIWPVSVSNLYPVWAFWLKFLMVFFQSSPFRQMLGYDNLLTYALISSFYMPLNFPSVTILSFSVWPKSLWSSHRIVK